MTDQEGKLLLQIAADVKDLQKGADEAKNILQKVGDKAEKEGNRIDNAMKKVGAAMAGYFTFEAAKGFIQKVAEVRGEIESLEVSFRSLVGNKEQADALFASIREFAVNTPMQMKDLAKGAQTLLSFNIEAEKVMPTLKMLGDVSMGDAQKFNSLTLAFAQMSSTGKLMGQDLLQMINAGFNPLTEIAAKTGKSIAELKDDMSKGAISVKMVEEAFASATGEGGKFYNMLEEQSKTLNGALSNLQGAIDDFFNAMGEQTQGVMVNAVTAATDLVKNYEKLGQVLADIIVVFGTYKAALIVNNTLTAIATQQALGYTKAQLAQYYGMLALEKAQKALNKTMLSNPYVALAAGLAALGVVIYRLATNSSKTESAIKGLGDAINETNTEIQKETKEAAKLFTALKNAKEGTDEYKSAHDTLMSKYGQYLQNLTDEKGRILDIAAAYEAVTMAAAQAARVRGFEKFTSSIEDAYLQDIGEARLKLEKYLKKKLGEEQGAEAFAKAQEYINTENIKGLAQYLNGLNVKGQFGISGFNDIVNAQRNKTKGIAEAEKRFGVTTQELQDKQLKDQQAEAEAAAKQQEEQERAEREAKAKADAEANKKAVEEKKKRIQSNAEDIRKLEESIAEENAQADVDRIENASERSLQQMELDHQKNIKQIQQQEADLKKLNAQMVKDNAISPESITDGLTQDQSSALNTRRAQEDAAYKQSKQKLYTDLLGQYEDYLTKRQNIQNKYAGDRNTLLAGVSSENITEEQANVAIAENKSQEAAALAALDSEFAQKSESFKAFMTEIEGLTLTEIQNALDALRKELKEVEGDVTKTEQVAVLKEKITKGEQLLTERKPKSLSPTQQNIQDWQDFSNAINDCGQSIATIGAQFGGTIEEISSGIGQMTTIATSVISTIASTANAAGTSMSLTAIMAAESLSMVEKASVILAIISAAVQVVTIVVKLVQSLINKEKEKAKAEQEAAAKRIEAETKVNKLLIEQNRLVEEGTKIFENRLRALAGYQQQITQYQHLARQMARDNFGGVRTDAWFGSDGFLTQEARTSIEWMLDSMTWLDAQTRAAYQAILDYDDAARNAADNIEGYISDVFGSLKDNLMDALSDALNNGTDAVEAFAKATKDKLGQVLEDLAYDLFFADIFNELETDIENIIGQRNSGILSPEGFMAALNAALQSATLQIGANMDAATSFLQTMKEQYDLFNREAKNEGIATASQESVDELNGRMTAVQGHTFRIAENTTQLLETARMATQNTTDILQSVLNIEANTSAINGRMEQMDSKIDTMGRHIENIALQGVNIR